MKKVFPALCIVLFGMMSAQNTPGVPCFPGDPCDAPASPIDMYVYVLAIAAVVMTVVFAKRYKTQKV